MRTYGASARVQARPYAAYAVRAYGIQQCSMRFRDRNFKIYVCDRAWTTTAKSAPQRLRLFGPGSGFDFPHPASHSS